MRRLLRAGIAAAELAVIGLMVALNHLYHTKAGVNHHVIARKQQWTATLLSDGNRPLLILAICAVCLGAIGAAYRGQRKQKNHFSVTTVSELLATLLAGALGVSALLPALLGSWPISPYLLFGAAILLLLQLFGLWIDAASRRK